MSAYIDTNIIVAKYVPTDPYHARSKAFLESVGSKKVVSPLTVVELMAVTCRQEEALQAPKEILKEPVRKRTRAIVEFFLRDSNLTLISIQASARMKIARSIVTVPLEYATSLRLATSLKLKTTDLMHLAYAENFRSSGEELDSFITTDAGILRKSDDIQKLLKIKAKQPPQAT